MGAIRHKIRNIDVRNGIENTENRSSNMKSGVKFQNYKQCLKIKR